MQSLTQIPDVVAFGMICLAALFATDLLSSDETPDEAQSWGDDPTVVAMLSGMSL